MSIFEVLMIGVGLSMDAFAAAVCKGLSMRKAELKNILIIGLFFGGFQALMPVIGFFLGIQFEEYIVSVDHWIAFTLLLFIGGKMILDAVRDDGEESRETPETGLKIREILILAVATSIDALAVGITLALLPGINIFSAAAIIGILTFVVSAVGLKIGNVFGVKYKSKAELVGGILLVLIGSKILFEHLGIISF